MRFLRNALARKMVPLVEANSAFWYDEDQRLADVEKEKLRSTSEDDKERRLR